MAGEGREVPEEAFPVRQIRVASRYSRANEEVRRSHRFQMRAEEVVRDAHAMQSSLWRPFALSVRRRRARRTRLPTGTATSLRDPTCEVLLCLTSPSEWR